MKHYIMENGCKQSEVEILKRSGNLITMRLVKSGQVLRLPEHRVFQSENAEEHRCSMTDNQPHIIQ